MFYVSPNHSVTLQYKPTSRAANMLKIKTEIFFWGWFTCLGLGLSCWVPNEPCQEVPGMTKSQKIYISSWGLRLSLKRSGSKNTKTQIFSLQVWWGSLPCRGAAQESQKSVSMENKTWLETFILCILLELISFCFTFKSWYRLASKIIWWVLRDRMTAFALQTPKVT